MSGAEILSRPYLCASRCLTRTSEGIHEGGEGPGEHLEEGVSYWVALGPTQCCVLQDVWNTSAVHWGRAETNTEGGVCVCVWRGGGGEGGEETIA